MVQEKEQSPRETAVAVLDKVLTEGAYANLELGAALKDSGLARRDRAFITQEVYGVLRHLTSLDYYISSFLQAPLKRKEARLQSILRLGFFEILHTDIPARATVNEMVELAKKSGPAFWGKLTNGVLRNLIRKQGALLPPAFAGKAEEAAFLYSLPLWLLQLWRKELGEAEMLALAAAMDRISPINLRVNTLKTNRETLTERLKEAGAEFSLGKISPDCVKYLSGPPLEQQNFFQAGLCTVQEEASQMAAIVLDPQPDAEILDLCAAPGGKTGHLAQRMENRGHILALDIHPHKLALIDGNVRRLGIQIVEAETGDGRTLAAAYDGRFDGVLLDAPCSGLGVLHRRLDARYKIKEESIPALRQIQRDLLRRIARLLKPGGKLVYSTCTISKEENQGNIEWFLKQEKDFAPVDICSFFPGLPKNQFSAPHMLQLLPSRHDCDGFFIACCQKKGDGGDV